MPYTTTATELQRNYKKFTKKAKDIAEPMVVLSNNQPIGIYLDYEALQDKYEIVEKKRKSNKSDFSEFLGIWTKAEAIEFNKSVEEMNERIDAEDWK